MIRGLVLIAALVALVLAAPAPSGSSSAALVPAAATASPSPSASGSPTDACSSKKLYSNAWEDCETVLSEKVCVKETGGAFIKCYAEAAKRICSKEGWFSKGICEQDTEQAIMDYANAQSLIHGPGKVAGGVVNTIATSMFDAIAMKIGASAMWLLQQFASVFLSVSTINLANAGILGVYQYTWALSALVAVGLMALQMGKLGLTGDGKIMATTLIGLARWSLVTMATFAVVQMCLTAADQISTWLINGLFTNNTAFQQRLGQVFGTLLTSSGVNTPLILVFGLIAIILLALLWGEMLLRTAAIQILVAVMPITASGTIADAGREWWPKARNALISLVLMKPVIVLLFVIGFSELGDGTGIESFLVGLLTVTIAAIAWPALAKFVTFTSAGGGGSFVGGLIGAAGGTAGSMFAARGGTPSGAGAAAGSKAYTGALASENAQAAGSGSGSGSGGAGFFGRAAGSGGGGAAKGAGGFASMGPMAAAAMAFQAAKVGKEALEGGMENMAGHAGLSGGNGNMGNGMQLPVGGGGRAPGGGGGTGTATAPVPSQGTPPPRPPSTPPGPGPTATPPRPPGNGPTTPPPNIPPPPGGTPPSTSG